MAFTYQRSEARTLQLGYRTLTCALKVSGKVGHEADREDWERVLSSAAHLQEFLPDAVLVGVTASAMHVEHRFSNDADHVIVDLVGRFTKILSDLEAHAGWRTNRLRPPVLILGNFEGVETGVRNLIRAKPLEVEIYKSIAGPIRLPTLHEMARIKAWLVVSRNSTRDFIDFVALADKIEAKEGHEGLVEAMGPMDELYPQDNGYSVLLQLTKQLAEPKPHDLGNGDLGIYRLLDRKWTTWHKVEQGANRVSAALLLKYRRQRERDMGR